MNLAAPSPQGPSRLAIGTCAALLGTAVAACLLALVPALHALVFAAAFAWLAWPGVIIARRMLPPQSRPWLTAVLLGTPWGCALSSLVMLGLWVAGARHPAVLALAPLLAVLAALPASRLAGAIDWPELDRRDLVALLLLLLIVPAVVGRPFARVGEMRPEGRAYRAYFIADLAWAMAVTAEVSKGEVPPRNPFLDREPLHYYWLLNLASSIEHRETRDHLPVEAVLLANALFFDLGFVGFFYLFVRTFVRSPGAAAAACAAAVLCTSLEGAQQLYVFWHRGVPFDGLRDLNIDAISNWKFGSLKVDGLQRLLLYQPHHATSWAISLSALLLVSRARDNGRPAVNAVAGALLGLALLVSSFIALMVGSVVAGYQAATLLWRRRWLALLAGGVAAAVPAAVATLVARALQYVDTDSGPIAVVGHLNPVAATNTLVGIGLSFGPILVATALGAAIAVRQKRSPLGVLAWTVTVGWLFYFFVDVVDHQHAYVAWRAGHLLFIAFAPVVGLAIQEVAAAGRGARVAGAVLAGVLVLASLPTTVIDLYNSQDTENQRKGPGFRWTEVVTPDELQALDWVKQHTDERALVQVDPVREPGTWAYMPAFGERRMAAGMPISMIPIKRYRDASQRMRELFLAGTAERALRVAREWKVDYLFIGPAERRAYPKLAAVLDGAPEAFRPRFTNATVSIYEVVR